MTTLISSIDTLNGDPRFAESEFKAFVKDLSVGTPEASNLASGNWSAEFLNQNQQKVETTATKTGSLKNLYIKLVFLKEVGLYSLKGGWKSRKTRTNYN